jgi:hypothetical protein
MSLAQLTDKGTTIRGYTKLQILMRTITGELIMLEEEAYMVRGMSVPILLGEDFQINYELGVIRNVETGSKIVWRNLPYEVEATGIEPYAGRKEVHQLAAGLTTHAQSVTKAKGHQRAKAKRRCRALKAGLEARLVRAAQDYRVRVHECKMVAVEGNFNEDKEWLVERNLLANTKDSFFTVPNTLISLRKLIVLVSNMSPRPRMIRKGEILGTLKDPQEFFDSPSSKEDLKLMRAQTALVRRLVNAETNLAREKPRKQKESKEAGES